MPERREDIGQLIPPPIPMWEVTANADGPKFDVVVLVEVGYGWHSEANGAVMLHARYITDSDIQHGIWRLRHPISVLVEKHVRTKETLDALRRHGHHQDYLGVAYHSTSGDVWEKLNAAWLAVESEHEQRRVKSREYQRARKARLAAAS